MPLPPQVAEILYKSMIEEALPEAVGRILWERYEAEKREMEE